MNENNSRRILSGIPKLGCTLPCQITIYPRGISFPFNSIFLIIGERMAEEISIIHKHAVFFDEILNCIPASLYLQPTEEDNQRWKKAFKVLLVKGVFMQQNNKSAEKVKEMKENAQKRRKERFNPSNNLSMVEQIEERKKQLEKEEEEEIATAVPLVPVNRLIILLFITDSCEITG